MRPLRLESVTGDTDCPAVCILNECPELTEAYFELSLCVHHLRLFVYFKQRFMSLTAPNVKLAGLPSPLARGDETPRPIFELTVSCVHLTLVTRKHKNVF
jgi:hypothetical protein